MEHFFMITPNGDGGLTVRKLTKEKLEKQLDQELRDGLQRKFLFSDQLEEMPDLNDDKNEAFIIQGRVIVPTPVKTVVKYSLDSDA
jgi:hypothetical protein